MASKVLVAKLTDKVPVYALLGARGGIAQRQTKLGPTVRWCEVCSTNRAEREELKYRVLKPNRRSWAWSEKYADPERRWGQEILCYYTEKVTKRVRVAQPVHCATCRCEGEFTVKERWVSRRRPGHDVRCGVRWSVMRRFLATFGRHFTEYWCTSCTVPAPKYKDAVVRASSQKMAYAFPNIAAAFRFVRRKINAYTKDRILRMRLELVFRSWARLSQTRFVGRYQSK